MDITPYLHLMADKGASDMYFSVGARPNVRIEGRTTPVGKQPLDADTVRELAYGLLSEEQRATFEAELELNTAIAPPGIGRFRVNVFRQRGEVAMVIRYIHSEVPPFETLGLPPVLGELMMRKNGLILVVGATGTGKSTTLAAMIDHRNASAPGHILTIEDPIEFVHQHKRSVVDQREVGLDTLSYDDALRNALREAPDVIVIGEIRDADTMQYALHYAETGHLCVSTLHASNAVQALERIVNFFPDPAHPRLFQDLSLHLQAVISQRLIRGTDGKRVAAIEVMMMTPHMRDLVEQGRLAELRDVIESTDAAEVQSVDNALYALWRSGRISKADALRHADSAHNLRLRIQMDEPDDGSVDLTLQVGDETPPPAPPA